jgi:hypothetical protein
MPRLRKIRGFLYRRCATEWQLANYCLAETDRTYEALMAQAEKQGKSHEERQELNSEWGAVREPDEHEVRRVETRYWRSKAARHRIPLPPRDEVNWDHYPHMAASYLTDAGIDWIETRIYQKRQQRLAPVLSILTAITGLVGVLTGLAAVLAHRG